MKTITVNTSRPYDVIIGENLISDAGEYISEIHSISTAVIITDDIVDGLYSETLCNSLSEHGYFIKKFIFKSGEHSKNIETYTEILRFLADNHITRSDVLIALGGGVVGDITGFVAATYLRGIAFIQIPTTFLSSIDSAIGGNTGIDLAEGKNLVGVFCQPNLVLCDTSVLKLLPERIFSEGAAEAIKYGIINDKDLFENIESGKLRNDLEDAVYRCVKIKSKIVEQDEFETGCRRILNFGHTIGHALEALEEYDITHGHAVAIGMCVITHAAYANNYCTEEMETRLKNALRLFGLPTECKAPMNKLIKFMENDKKREGENITLILPKDIGEVTLETYTIDELSEFFNK